MAPSSAPYVLSASFEGHEDDVRAVTFLNANEVASSSRDATVRLWKLDAPPRDPGLLALHGKEFINSIATIPPTDDYPLGLIFAGARDAIIDARAPTTPIDQPAEALLVGHAGNVCALDVAPDNTFLVSGSWDCSAKLWRIGKWECEITFEGHQGSVWAVLAYDSNTIITGCADKQIRVFDITGKLRQTITGTKDVVRALCRLPPNHPSGARFASAGNDGIIRLWTLQGQQLAELHGHENFVYSIASLPTGELVSSGEDRTVRIWQGDRCVQTITHPAISVWSVAACGETGDIVSGASDRIVRVFTRDHARKAEASVLHRFEKSVQESAIPAQQVGNINKDKLPGPEFIQQKSGTKDGQVQMIREANGSVSAYTWSSAANKWENVGTVVDSVGSSGKKVEYNGQDYDYVFDVDIEDGKPPLHLPYNLSQNPYVVAQKFIADNELPVSYIDQVTQFIITNTQGAALDNTSASAPEQVKQETEQPRILPQKTFLSIKEANLKVIHKKIKEINSKLESEGKKDITLNPGEIDLLDGLIEEMQRPGPLATSLGLEQGLLLVARIATEWPASNRIPGLDLLRILAAATPRTAETSYNGTDLITLILQSRVFDVEDLKVNNAMLAVRAITNLFEHEAGRNLVISHLKELTPPISILTGHCLQNQISNRNLVIALATLYINLAVYEAKQAPAHETEAAVQQSLLYMKALHMILTTEKDSEAIYRALVALGTIIFAFGPIVVRTAKDRYDIPAAFRRVLALDAGREPRIQAVTREIMTKMDQISS